MNPKTKIRLGCGLLAACCLAAGLHASAVDGAGETLVSRSYLNNTFRPSLEKSVQQRVESGAQAVYDAALAQVNALGEQHTQGQGGSQGGWTVSPAFRPMAVSGGDVLTLDQGGSLLWLAGSGTAPAGLVDATVGAELPAGGALTAGHRYLNGLESALAVTIRSDAASAAPAGRWSLTPGGLDVTSFYDLGRSDWFYDGVRWAISGGIFKGVSATEFRPGGTVDRAVLATVLHRLEGAPEEPYLGSFSDVPPGQWYTAGIEWAAAHGIVSGNGDGTFSPSRAATREQIAVMLYRYAQYLGQDVTAAGSLAPYPDAASVHDWAAEAMCWAVGAGILKGDSTGALLPHSSATRAQVAIMLQRFSNLPLSEA